LGQYRFPSINTDTRGSTLAKKLKKTTTSRQLTRRAASRKEREQKTRRIILIAGAFLLVLILGFSGFGYYDSQYKPYHAVVLKVNDTKVDQSYFDTMLEIYARQYSINSRTLLTSYADTVLSSIEGNLMIIQGAPQLGYSLNPAEITQGVKDNGAPDQPVYRDLYTEQVLVNLLTSEYFGPKVSENATQANVEALVFESKDAALNGINLLNSGSENFTDLAKIYGVEQVTKTKGGELGWIPQGLTAQILGYTDNTAANVLESLAFSQPIGNVGTPTFDPNISKGTGWWLVKLLEKSSDNTSCHIDAMLVGSIEEAQTMKTRIAAGEDFGALASQYSQDEATKASAGDMGWLQVGYGNALLYETAMKLGVGQTSDPMHDVAITTKGGWWVVRVLEKQDNKPIDATVRQNIISQYFQNWLGEVKANTKIEELLTAPQKQFAIDLVAKKLNIKQQ
jgi:parvulin-like peptidyl-prolyl isomerase